MKKLFLLLALLFTSAEIFSQQPGWINYTYAGNVVAMANEGDYIWAATEGGLVKLNTITLEKEFFNKANSGLPSNNITAIAVDKQGNKWIGTPSGLVKYDGSRWEVFDATGTTLRSSSGIYDFITIFVTKENNIWISQINGLSLFDGVNWTSYNAENLNIPYFPITAEIAEDSSGILWMAAGSLAKYDGKSWKFYNYVNSGIPYGINSMKHVRVDKDQNIWITTEYLGLIKFDRKTWKIYSRQNSDIPSDIIKGITIDGSNKKWIFTLAGLASFDDYEWKIYNSENSEFPFFDVFGQTNTRYSITTNSRNNIWFGLPGKIIRVNENSPWTKISPTNNTLGSKSITALASEKDDTIWIGGSSISSVRNNIWRDYTDEIRPLIGTSTYISAMGIDSSGNKWFGTANSVLKYNGSAWEIFPSSQTNVHNPIKIVAERDGSVWFLSTNSFVRFDGSNWVNISAPFDLLGQFMTIEVDKSGNKWLGGPKGLLKFDNDNWSLILPPNIISPTYAQYGYALMGISDIVFDNTEKMWTVGTDLREYSNSVWRRHYLIDSNNLSGFQSLPSSGSPSYFFYSNSKMMRDGKGNTWMTNLNAPLSRYDGSAKVDFTNKNSPLVGAVNSMISDPRGDIWIATSEGLLVYSENLSDVEEQPKENFSSALLEQNFPNPAQNFTTIRYTVPEGIAGDAPVEINLFDPMGKEIFSLLNEHKPSGTYEEKFDVSSLENGVYFYRLRVGNTTETRQLVIMR